MKFLFFFCFVLFFFYNSYAMEIVSIKDMSSLPFTKRWLVKKLWKHELNFADEYTPKRDECYFVRIINDLPDEVKENKFYRHLVVVIRIFNQIYEAQKKKSHENPLKVFKGVYKKATGEDWFGKDRILIHDIMFGV